MMIVMAVLFSVVFAVLIAGAIIHDQWLHDEEEKERQRFLRIMRTIEEREVWTKRGDDES